MPQLGVDEARIAFRPSSSVSLNRIVKMFTWQNVSGNRRFVYVTEERQWDSFQCWRYIAISLIDRVLSANLGGNSYPDCDCARLMTTPRR